MFGNEPNLRVFSGTIKIGVAMSVRENQLDNK